MTKPKSSMNTSVLNASMTFLFIFDKAQVQTEPIYWHNFPDSFWMRFCMDWKEFPGGGARFGMLATESSALSTEYILENNLLKLSAASKRGLAC